MSSRVFRILTPMFALFVANTCFLVHTHAASIMLALKMSENASSVVSLPSTQLIPNAGQCVRNSARFSHDWTADEVVRVQDLSPSITLASSSRLVNTVWLAWAALHLPGGDFVETGVWRGGSSVLLMKVLLTFDSCNRTFWAFDTFTGLPKLTKMDKIGTLAKGRAGKFKATRQEYVTNLQDYGAYDSNVVSITDGLLSDTLPHSQVAHISFLRLDGKLYEATWDALVYLYSKVIPGGYIYVNDYNSYNGCKRAVDEFREKWELTSRPLQDVYEGDEAGQGAVWWIK